MTERPDAFERGIENQCRVLRGGLGDAQLIATGRQPEVCVSVRIVTLPCRRRECRDVVHDRVIEPIFFSSNES